MIKKNNPLQAALAKKKAQEEEDKKHAAFAARAGSFGTVRRGSKKTIQTAESSDRHRAVSKAERIQSLKVAKLEKQASKSAAKHRSNILGKGKHKRHSRKARGSGDSTSGAAAAADTAAAMAEDAEAARPHSYGGMSSAPAAATRQASASAAPAVADPPAAEGERAKRNTAELNDELAAVEAEMAAIGGADDRGDEDFAEGAEGAEGAEAEAEAPQEKAHSRFHSCSVTTNDRITQAIKPGDGDGAAAAPAAAAEAPAAAPPAEEAAGPSREEEEEEGAHEENDPVAPLTPRTVEKKSADMAAHGHDHRHLSMLSMQALDTLGSLGAKFKGAEDRVDEIEKAVDDRATDHTVLIKMKNELSLLSGRIDKLQMTEVDAVMTGPLTSGKADARAQRKGLNRTASGLIARIKALRARIAQDTRVQGADVMADDIKRREDDTRARSAAHVKDLQARMAQQPVGSPVWCQFQEAIRIAAEDLQTNLGALEAEKARKQRKAKLQKELAGLPAGGPAWCKVQAKIAELDGHKGGDKSGGGGGGGGSGGGAKSPARAGNRGDKPVQDDPAMRMANDLKAFYTKHKKHDKAAAAKKITAKFLKENGGNVKKARRALNDALMGQYNGDGIDHPRGDAGSGGGGGGGGKGRKKERRDSGCRVM